MCFTYTQHMIGSETGLLSEPLLPSPDATFRDDSANKGTTMAVKKGMNLNLMDQLLFYGSYHNNVWNKIIHFVFVPSIIWSVCVWLAATGPLLPTSAHFADAYLPKLLHGSAVPNAAAALITAYTLFYVVLEPFAGLSWGLLVGLPTWVTATAFQAQVPHAWAWALGVQVFSWYMQIHPGHALCEGRKPALLDSMFQAFALAPLFVWFEALFLCGYRPALHAELKRHISKELEKQQAHLRGHYSETNKGVKVNFYLRMTPKHPVGQSS